MRQASAEAVMQGPAHPDEDTRDGFTQGALGSGRRLFPDGGVPAKFELVDVKQTTTGVLLATYEPRLPSPGHLEQ